jgi:hypothetical protein
MRSAFLLSVFLLINSGCLALDGNDPVDVSDGLVIVEPGTPWPKLDEFDLKAVRTEGDELVISVAYAGGCAEHAFTYYTNGPILKTNPPGADIIVRHDSNGDNCEAYLHQDLRVDLTPIRVENRDSVLVHVQADDFNSFVSVTYAY